MTQIQWTTEEWRAYVPAVRAARDAMDVLRRGERCLSWMSLSAVRQRFGLKADTVEGVQAELNDLLKVIHPASAW